ncbi:MAG: two-component regulator propeller domain-containing protein [Acidobacteriota bacterium]|nr:two-component regulator propeller domain-containing protein [Acidobacteriota bacterium]
MRLIIITALLTAGVCSASGPTQMSIRLAGLNVGDDLSHNDVRCLIQDRNGFIWMGSREGLNRYDGYNFKTIRHDPDNLHSLPDNFVRALLETGDGRIWIGTAAGLCALDPSTGNLTNYPVQRENAQQVDVQTLLEDRAGRLWMGTNGTGLFCLDLKKNQWIAPGDLPPIDHENIRSILQDSSGNLWFGTGGGGLYRYSPETGDLEHFRQTFRQEKSISHDFILTLCETRDGYLWAGTYGGGLNRYHPETGEFKRYKSRRDRPDRPGHNVIWCLREDREGRLWVGTYGGGLNIYDADTGIFRRFRHNADDPKSLAADNVWSLLEDETGQIWIGTSGGLSRYDPGRDRFGHHYRDPNQVNSLSDNYVRAIYETRAGQLWIGTNDGLNLWDEEHLGYRVFNSDAEDPESLSHDQIWSISEDGLGYLWVGTSSGLNRFDPFTGTFKRYYRDIADHDSLSHDTITALSRDAAGRLWAGTYGGGLNRYEEDSDRFFRYRYDQENQHSLSHNVVSIIYLDTEERLWVGTLGGGLNEYIPGSGSFVRYGWDRNKSESLNSDEILALHRDSRGILWIGTRNRGLYRFEPGAPGEAGSYTGFELEKSIARDTIYAILEDSRGHLWLSSDEGLCRIDPLTGKGRDFRSHEGLQGDQFNGGAGVHGRDGMLYFGGPNGFNAFKGAGIRLDPIPPKVRITDFLLFNQSVPLQSVDPESPLTRPITATEKLVLEYHQSVVAFEFAALHFASPEHNTYAFKLDGVNKDWVETDAEKRFAYYNLDSGSYTFRVKGANKDGVWSTTDTTLDIRVKPPPWKTWWAYSLYALALSFVFLQSLRLTRERRQAEQDRNIADQERLTTRRLRQLDKLKDQFLANTSHELRTPLNGIIGLTESIIETTDDLDPRVAANLEMVVASGRRLANLVNDILDFSKLRHEQPELHLVPVNLRRQAELVLTMSRPLAGGKELELVNSIDEDFPRSLVDENRLQQILYNLVGNAVKFTDSGRVVISACEEGEQLQVRVEDTGIGIPADKQDRIFESFEQADGSAERAHGGTGLGLAITRQLVELHGGTIQVYSTPGKGSCFVFTLPRAPQHAEAVEAQTREPEQIAEIQPGEVPVTPADVQGNAHIMLIDDEPINRQVLVNHLAPLGYRITQTSSGPEALTAIEKDEFDLVIVDVMMPRMSGYEVCRALRDRFHLHELPILFLTARNQLADLTAGFDAGGNDYLTKPVSKAELLTRVKTHLQLRNVNRDLEIKVKERTHDLEQKREEVLYNQRQLFSQEKSAALGTLTAGVAHEINNPTNFAHGSVQLLETELKDFKKFLLELASDEAEGEVVDALQMRMEPLFAHVRTITDGTRRIRDIVRDLHAFSTMEEGRETRVVLDNLVKATLNLVQPKFKDRIHFRTRYSREPLITVGRPAELSQVFLHLTLNACQAAEDHAAAMGSGFEGVVSVGTQVMDGRGIITFKDNGGGIPEEVRHRIFEPFFTTRDIGGGVGLGLSIAWGIIDRAGGHIQVLETSSRGTTFKVTLPLRGEA